MLYVLFFIPYLLGMLYGFFMLASFWSARELRGIPDYVFFVFGLMVPLIGWFISVFAWPFFFVVPASLGFVYWRAREHARGVDAGAESVRADERENALRMLAADEKNAAAYWSLGQIAEAEKKYDEALAHYERAHAADERTVTRQELDDIRSRLASFKELEIENPFLEEEARAGRRRERWETAFLWLAAGLLFADWAYAVDLCAMMLFLKWFKPVKRAGTLLS